MRRCFVVGHGAHHHLAVLAPEVEEVQQELAWVEFAVRVQPARADALFVHVALRDRVQYPRQDLGVDRVGRGVDRVGRGKVLAGQLPADQAQVQHILHVGLRALVLPAHQHRLDHPSHPFLTEFVGQLVQMRVITQDQCLAGLAELRLVDHHRAIAIRADFPHRLLGQRIDQPRLTLRRGPRQFQCFGREDLARRRRVLGVQRFHLRSGEIAKPDAFGLDIEGRSASDDLAIRPGQPVIPHVAHAAQHDGLREMLRPVGVAGADLPQQRDQGVADQRVDLVEEKHDRLRAELAEALQHARQRGGGTAGQ